MACVDASSLFETRFIYVVGIGTCAYYFFILLRTFILGIKGFVLPRFQRQSNEDLVKKYGSWAVVTGATDGIGLAYAKELAARKVNIVLISRTEEKLKRVSSEIENEFSVQTKIITADFKEGRPVYERIEKELKHIPVGILVNNVGMFMPNLLSFTEMSDDLIWDMVNVNVLPVLILSRMLLPSMKENRKGAIVNVSSILELQPSPLSAVYAATKIFIRNFTKALQYENSEYGLTIQILSPSFVLTNLSNLHGKVNEWAAPTAKEYVQQAIGTLGVLDHTTGYQKHGIMTTIVQLFAERLRTVLVASTLGAIKKCL